MPPQLPPLPRAPSPGDDATPFIIRCYLRIAPFRPPLEFDHVTRPLDEEFKVYVWRTTTLRDILRHLHSTPRNSHVEPSLLKDHTSPLSLVLSSEPEARHAFRLVYYDSHIRAWKARDIARDVCRISKEDRLRLEKEADELLAAGQPKTAVGVSGEEKKVENTGTGDVEMDGGAATSSSPAARDGAGETSSKPPAETARSLRPSSSSKSTSDAEQAARQTLGSLDMREGDILDIVVLPNGVTMAPAIARGPAMDWAAREGVVPGGAGLHRGRGGRGGDLFPTTGPRSTKMRVDLLPTGRADQAGKWGHVADERRGGDRRRGDARADRGERMERRRSRSPVRRDRSRSPARERRRSRSPDRSRP